jgi:hypothetical protein
MDHLKRLRVMTNAKAAIVEVLSDAVRDCEDIDPIDILRDLLRDCDVDAVTPSVMCPKPASTGPTETAAPTRRASILAALTKLGPSTAQQVAEECGDASARGARLTYATMYALAGSGILSRNGGVFEIVRASTEVAGPIDMGPRVLAPPALATRQAS